MSAEFREKLKKLVFDYIDTANMDYILDLTINYTEIQRIPTHTCPICNLTISSKEFHIDTSQEAIDLLREVNLIRFNIK